MKPIDKDKPITGKDITLAVADLTVLKYFPPEPIARAKIMQLIANMIATKGQLDWWIATMVNRVGIWNGPAEARGVFCARFRPADGVEVQATLPGFTALDSEATRAIEGSATEPLALPGEVPVINGKFEITDPRLLKLSKTPEKSGLRRVTSAACPAWLKRLA